MNSNDKFSASHPSNEIILSVVICTYNRSALLRRNLEAFIGIGARKSVEIIVVNNNSTDGTAGMVSEMTQLADPAIEIIYCNEEKQGLSNARNRG
ncbi:MAG: glycosyltransferase family 2 protein, partial [Syntrophales bacterium LBB04]|nr:glycosyltransferase family 2 protein [Syntrophales bacterium LBB04]